MSSPAPTQQEDPPTNGVVTVDPVVPVQKKVKPLPEKLLFQIALLMWKRYAESTKSKWDLLKLVVPAVFIFVLLILIYTVFDFFADDGVEPFFVPFAFWVFIQRLVVHIMYEKSSKLQESMRMMGLSDFAYWTSYFITDGIITGFALSFLCTLFTVGGLFNSGNFGTILGLLFSFCLAAVPFSFFLCSFFDTPQTSGQATLGILFGLYIVYIVVFVAHTGDMDEKAAQRICCLFPPMALQIGSGSFQKSYDGIPMSEICGLLIADIFIYSVAAWYFSQVWPSKVGVPKPFYFVIKPSYWLPQLFAKQQQSYEVEEITNVIGASPEKEEDVDIIASNNQGADAVQNSSNRPKALEVCEDEDGDTSGVNTSTNSGTHNSSNNNGNNNKDYDNGNNLPAAKNGEIPEEPVNEGLLGAPTVIVNKLRKSFGFQVAVNNLSFSMYENQIFALLGHNGAGKTTTINMLTGLMAPDWTFGGEGATIYGSNVLTEMEQIRLSMGVCPQHDVLFESLTVREHIIFFAQLKGASLEEANTEATELTNLFHLERRLDHLGNELSGGQRRKLSVAIAVCGGSKFVVLDEPTAGMDPLARRELWDLLASLRMGRTMLLTTHYMDEADILGDRVGIMSLGQMQCVGTTQFLKTTFGAGYKLIFDKAVKFGEEQLTSLVGFVQSFIPSAKAIEEDGAEQQALFNLPFNTVDKFGAFFSELESEGKMEDLQVTNFGVNITSLEDVFLKVGEDHTVTPKQSEGPVGIGANRKYHSNLHSQIIGIAKRKFTYCLNDFITIPLLLLPMGVAIAAAVLYQQQVISDDDFINDLVVAGMYAGAYLGAPGLIAEFIVRERNEKLRNVLTVMGCDFKAYWIGTFIADYLIMSTATGVIFLSWLAADMTDYSESKNGLNFFIFLLFNVQLIAFSYFFSYVFTSPKSCISLMPIIILLLLITPNIVLLIVIQVTNNAGGSISQSVQGGILLWGSMILSPHGALFSTMLDTTQDYSDFISSFPPVGASIAFMATESVLYLGYAYYTDAQSVAVLSAAEDPTFNPKVLDGLDEDVLTERANTLSTQPLRQQPETEGGDLEGGQGPGAQPLKPLRIERLRKKFPPKHHGAKPVTAVVDLSFQVESGEIFGLLGANGAGKTTALSMLTRHLVPTSGDAFITEHSILSEFSKGATHLGVVTQNNSLWDRLSVEAHLKLFARLRGVPEDLVKQVVSATIDQLELTPHRKKLAMRLSGGMKRKLCVAIALIGDPEVVLLDEPSAGLDPVSRRNLWSVILRTMSHRAVILTTHSMDEAEALCKRIGIMVQGQLHALGTKQHLKTKFGSGFELVVKLHVNDLPTQMEQMLTFVKDMFPSAVQIAENGGLITYQIPKEEMKMGLAFTKLEEQKEELQIEDYSIAQPTLEQVFIRTVNRHTPSSRGRATSSGGPNVIGGSSRMSVDDIVGENSNQDDDYDDNAAAAVEAVVNKCGCTNYTVKILIAVTAALTVVFLASAIGAGVAGAGAASAVLWVFAIIMLITSVVNCNVLCCACCQYPKDVED